MHRPIRVLELSLTYVHLPRGRASIPYCCCRGGFSQQDKRYRYDTTRGVVVSRAWRAVGVVAAGASHSLLVTVFRGICAAERTSCDT